MSVNTSLTVDSFGQFSGTVSNPYIVPYGVDIHNTTADETINISNQLSNLDTRLKDIEARLVILIPDPLLLEKHKALKEAYDHYKLMEKLLTENY